ncbi:hypothetical protein BT96DRAFT_990118 [Gymnopus androsaceus JB14]|uniref:Uncharacterized protein n=1 Tax=Gymnopus androsaceus JB14 TaxID=1447944 RepID=A0A6A4I2N9_9AGAR|nr:hypothetical protein BT96DRAFT_990118 [Gymnopus androsaceus JB14]
MAPSFKHEYMSSSGGDYTTPQSPPFSNHDDISESLSTSISFSNGNLADLLALDGTSDTYSEVDTKLYYSDGSDIVFVGAKYAPHDEAVNNANKNEILDKKPCKEAKEIVYTGCVKRQIIVHGKGGQSPQTPIDLTMTDSIFNDTLEEFCYGNTAQNFGEFGDDEHFDNQEM